MINENKVLGYLGYLGWLGTTVATMKQAIFALKDAHKRAGHGDSTNKMHRLWIVLNSLERMSAKRPRRLGVTVPMLKWIGEHLENGAAKSWGAQGGLSDATSGPIDGMVLHDEGKGILRF